MNKRGQGLSTNAIILIVLGVIVLVVLIVGFIAGWDKIAPWIKPSNNVDEIVKACGMACTMESVYDFCNMKRELVDEDKNKIEKTCAEFSLITKYAKYGIAKCNGISSCNSDVECGSYEVELAEGGTTFGIEQTESCGFEEDDVTMITKITQQDNNYCCIKY